MDLLKYQDYEGTAEIDTERRVCRGKILFIDDLVTYEAKNPADLQSEFEAAVRDYIETCNSIGKEPQKPLKGQFNVRIPANLHKEAVRRAHIENTTLNDVVVKALDAYVHSNKDAKNTFIISIKQDNLKTIPASVSSKTQWVSSEDLKNVKH